MSILCISRILQKKFCTRFGGTYTSDSYCSNCLQDVADLQKLMMEVGKEMNVKETKAAQRLFKKVNNMISKIDTVLHEVEKKEAGIVEDKKLEDESGAKAPISGEKTAEPAAASKTGCVFTIFLGVYNNNQLIIFVSVFCHLLLHKLFKAAM